MQIIVQDADNERVGGSVRIPNNADLLFASVIDVVTATSIDALQQAMLTKDEVTIQITDEPPELQVSSRLVHQAILSALLTRIRYPLVSNEVIRIVTA
jgi:hypothetical protein